MNQERNQRWFALWVLFGINTMNFYDRQIAAALTEPIRKEWDMTDTQIGWLATAFTLLYAAVGVPLGRLTDTWMRTRLLSVAISVWSVLTAASGLAWNYWSLFAARLGVGVGEAGCAPAANSLIGDLYPPSQRSRALSLFMMGLPIGLFLSFLLSGRIAHAYGWRAAFFLACLPGLVLAVLALKIREPMRGAAEEFQTAGRQREGSPYWRVLCIPTMWWIIVSGALHNFNMYAVGTFLTAFLSRYHGANLKSATEISAIVLGAAGVIGLLAGGWGADRLGRVRSDGRLLLSAFAMLLAAPCVYFALEQPPKAIVGFMALMGAGMMLTYFYYACVYAAIQEVVEPTLRGTAMALYFFAMYVLGASVGPLVTGKLSDSLARKAMAAANATLTPGSSAVPEQFKAIGLHSAMYIIPLLCLLLAVVLFMASRSVAADMEKLRAWMRQSDPNLKTND